MAIRVNPRPTKKVGRPATRTTALVPAAARTSEVLTAHEAALNSDAIEMFTKVVGGKDALINVLSIAATAPEVERVINLLIDPRYSDPHRWSLRRLCTLAGLTVADLFAAYRKALLTKAHIEATHIIATKLPPIVADVMDRATPGLLVCPHCEAKPAPAGDPPCLFCHGSGTMKSEPELDRQKLALELGQLIEKKGGGLFIQQNTGVLAPSALTAQGAGALEQLQQAVGDLLFTPSRRRAAAPAPIGDPPSEPTTFPRDEPRDPIIEVPREPDDPDDPDDDDDDDDDAEEDDDPTLN